MLVSRTVAVLAVAMVSLHFCAAQTSDPLATRPKISQALSLQEAVQIALRESPVLRGAVAELKAAIARVKQALAEKRPQLAVSASSSTGTEAGIFSSIAPVMPSAFLMLPRRPALTTNTMFMLPLFTGKRLESLIRQAEAIKEATAAQVETLRLDIALETRLAYWQAVLARELVRVAEAYVRTMEERVRLDREAAKVGRIPEFWVLRSEAELANARQMLTNAQRDAAIALIALKAVMGIHPDSDITLVDTFPSVTVPTDRTALLAEAFRLRPELKTAQQMVTAAEASVRAAKALYQPQVSLMVMADYMTGRGNNTGGYLAGIVASLPLLDGGRRKATMQENEAMREKATQGLEEVKLRIAQQVDTALQELLAATQNVKTAEAAVAAATEDLRVATVRYEVGRSVLVEYLDAVAALVRAEVQRAQALYELTVAHAKLLRAIGRSP